LPSQKPVVPQLAAPLSLHFPAGSAPPAAIGEQVPAAPDADNAHDIQVPLQAVAQQTPCAQTPLLHSVPPEQTAPFVLSPHEPEMQEAGIAQSPSAAQVALQALMPHPNGKQDDEAGTTQVPAPSQVPPGVKVVPLAGQAAPWQAVPC
jgi:hypothetical protein